MQMTLASDRRESMEFLSADGSRKLTTQTSHWSCEPVFPFTLPVFVFIPASTLILFAGEPFIGLKKDVI